VNVDAEAASAEIHSGSSAEAHNTEPSAPSLINPDKEAAPPQPTTAETPSVAIPGAEATITPAPVSPATAATDLAAPVTPAAAPATEKAEAAAPPPPEPTLNIDINLSNQSMTVSENGETKHTWAISSAAAGYRTPTGTFSPSWMSRMWYSRQYDWSPMPHAIFFHRGVAIHATYATRMLGRPASHGCVRLAPANAAALYKLVGKHGKSMTRIVVHGTPKHGPAIARGYDNRRLAAARRHYWNSYSYYYSPPSYYYGPSKAKRRAAARPYYYPAPRRYVSRGAF
jgi:lipoprotein-anchoring transpeptidase ErfK/SrfK